MISEEAFQYAEETPALIVRARAEGPDIRLVEVSGEIDLVTVGIMELAIAKAMQAPPLVLLVDLSDVTFMSSAGPNALVRARKDAELAGTDLRIVNGSRPVRRAFTLTALDDYFRLYPSRARAQEGTTVRRNT